MNTWTTILTDRINALTLNDLTQEVWSAPAIDEQDWAFQEALKEALELDCLPTADSLADAEITMAGRPEEQQVWPIQTLSEDYTEAWTTSKGEEWTNTAEALPTEATQKIRDLKIEFFAWAEKARQEEAEED